MIAATADQSLADYHQEAASWDRDRTLQMQRSARVAWRVAGAGWVCAVMGSGSLLVMMPLKHIEPFVVRVDNTTGVVDVVPVYAGNTTMDQSITRYFLAHYVTICERFNFATAESDYEECGAFHGSQRNQAWSALWSKNNPNSPLNVHKDGSTVRVQVESISFFQRGNGVSDLAQVRYVKAQRAASDADERFTHWIATVQFAYTNPSADPRTRRWNPLGFKIVEFITEPEVLATPSAANGRVQ